MVYPEENASAPRLGKKNSVRGRAGRSAPPATYAQSHTKDLLCGVLHAPMKPSMNGNQLPGDQASGRMTRRNHTLRPMSYFGSNFVAWAPSPARTTCSAASPPRDRRGINRVSRASLDIGLDVLRRRQLRGVPEFGDQLPPEGCRSRP